MSDTLDNETKPKNDKLKYSLWISGLIFLNFIVVWDAWHGTSLGEKWWIVILGSVGNFLVHGIYALIIWGVTLWFKYSKTFKRYIIILTWTTLAISGYSLNNKKISSSVAEKEIPERATKNKFFTTLRDSCTHRGNLIYPDRISEVKEACECMVQQATNTWSEDQINREDFVREKGVGDSMMVWIAQCFGDAGFYGYKGNK